MNKRYKSLTGKLRWIERHSTDSNGVKSVSPILQQQVVERDSSYLDWEGPHPVFSWEDVPYGGVEVVEAPRRD